MSDPSEEEVEGAARSAPDPLAEVAEHFTSGIGVNLTKDKFRTVMESNLRKKDFLESGGWKLTLEIVMLAFLRQLPKTPLRCAGDLLRVNAIVAKQLGYVSIYLHIKNRGWRIRPKRDKSGFMITRSKLREAAAASAQPGSGEFMNNAKAMVDALYEFLSNQGFLDPLTGKPNLRWVTKESFNQKLSQRAQDTQTMFMIVDQHILPAVETEKNNIDYWARIFFKGCRTRKVLQTFCHHFCAAVPEDEDAATEWIKHLLKNHPDSAIDEVARIASAESHQKQYNDRLEKELKDTFGNCGSGKRVSDKRHTLIAKGRLRDNYVAWLPAQKQSQYPSSTKRVVTNRKRTRNTINTGTFAALMHDKLLRSRND